MAKAKRKAVTAQSVNIKLNKLIAVLDAWTQPKGRAPPMMLTFRRRRHTSTS